MCVCDTEGPEAIWEDYPVARKPHKCCECSSIIGKGEKYQRIKGVWSGDFETFKTCMICYRVREEAKYQDKDLNECLAFGELWETVGTTYEYAA